MKNILPICILATVILLTGCNNIEEHKPENCNDKYCFDYCNWDSYVEDRIVKGKVISKEYTPESTKKVPGMAGKNVILVKKHTEEKYEIKIKYKDKIIKSYEKSIYDKYNIGDAVDCVIKVKIETYKGHIEEETIKKINIKE